MSRSTSSTADRLELRLVDELAKLTEDQYRQWLARNAPCLGCEMQTDLGDLCGVCQVELNGGLTYIPAATQGFIERLYRKRQPQLKEAMARG